MERKSGIIERERGVLLVALPLSVFYVCQMWKFSSTGVNRRWRYGVAKSGGRGDIPHPIPRFFIDFQQFFARQNEKRKTIFRTIAAGGESDLF